MDTSSCAAVAVPSSGFPTPARAFCTTLDVISYLAREGPIEAAGRLGGPATVWGVRRGSSNEIIGPSSIIYLA
jgi:hypothetical protein